MKKTLPFAALLFALSVVSFAHAQTVNTPPPNKTLPSGVSLKWTVAGG